ncbi:MAG: hypothetical protein ACREBC_12030, partial [Pyrinomonadaceae bacterium]
PLNVRKRLNWRKGRLTNNANELTSKPHDLIFSLRTRSSEGFRELEVRTLRVGYSITVFKSHKNIPWHWSSLPVFSVRLCLRGN